VPARNVATVYSFGHSRTAAAVSEGVRTWRDWLTELRRRGRGWVDASERDLASTTQERDLPAISVLRDVKLPSSLPRESRKRERIAGIVRVR